MCHNRNHGSSYVAASCWDNGTQGSSEVFCGCSSSRQTRSSSRQTGHMRADSLLRTLSWGLLQKESSPLT